MVLTARALSQFVLALLWIALPVFAQQKLATAATTALPIVEEAISQGIELERSRDWIKAIQHYETALRQNPGEPRIRRRLQISRLHHDVNRRINDGAIEQIINTASPATVLDLYSEILARLEMSYVDNVQLLEVVRGGTAYLEVALMEPAFIQSHVHPSRQEKVERFRNEIHKTTWPSPLASHRGSQYRRSSSRNGTIRTGDQTHDDHYAVALGAVGLLDPYSAFLSPSELSEVESQIEGNFVGLGVALSPTSFRFVF